LRLALAWEFVHVSGGEAEWRTNREVRAWPAAKRPPERMAGPKGSELARTRQKCERAEKR